MLMSTDSMILVDQLKEFVEGMIKVNYEDGTKSSLTYAKPYVRIDNLKLPTAYQPLSLNNLMAKEI